MMKLTLFAALTAALFFTATAETAAQPAQGPNRLAARTNIDLIPIPSRIEHGVISVRNAGSTASAPAIVTVNCHKPGQTGGCADLPPRCEARYTNPAYPNLLVLNLPAIQPGHVHNHDIACWDAMTWASGQYVFEFVADVTNTNAETNEANNALAHIWNVP